MTSSLVSLIRPIIQDSDPLLKTVSEPVTNFDEDSDELTDLIDCMLATMADVRGRGIAAIQIGVAKRVICVYAEGKLSVMINPVITRTLNRESVEFEGCLSIPRSKWRSVSRPAKCDVKWVNYRGEEQFGNFSGETARVVQHEIDHLDGILITDKPKAF